jgi:hypothetical protein
MRYLYPRSVKHFKYSIFLKKKVILPFITFKFITASKACPFFFRLTAFYVYRELSIRYPENFNPKSVCWINSRARWVFKDFHFSRGVIKIFFTNGDISGFKPNAW